MAVVSVIIPLFNKEKYVARAISSVLAQTFQDYEIIVVDDGSTDGGPEIVGAFQDPRIRLIRQPNAGPGAARNRGVKESSAPFVAFLDADDEHLPEFLQQSIGNLKANPHCAISAVNHFRGDMKTIATSMFPFNIGIKTGAFRLPADADAPFTWGSLIFCHTCAVLCRREIFLQYGGCYERRCTYGEDQYLWLKVLLNHPIYLDTTPLYFYHTQDSELELWARKTAAPVLPFLADPEPIRAVCPPELRTALEKMLPYAAALNRSYMVTDDAVVAFWKQALAGIPDVHNLPLDRPRPKAPAGRRGQAPIAFEPADAARIRTFCAAHAIEPENYFLACTGALLGQCSRDDTVVIGVPYADRKQEEIQSLFGNFIRTLPLRLDYRPDLSATTWIAHVRQQTAAAWRHTSIGFEELVDLAGVSRAANVHPLYQATFAFHANQHDSPTPAAPGCDLAIHLHNRDTFEGSIDYAADIFDADTAALLAQNFIRVARGLAEAPALGNIPLMDSAAWKLIHRVNRTHAPALLGRTFVELFKETAARAPAAPAVKTCDGFTLTYRDLDDASDAVARRLLAAGTKPGDAIGLYMHRDRWLLPALIGIFKTGAAYVPLDPLFPHNRLATILDDSGARIIAATAHDAPEVAVFAGDRRAVSIDTGPAPAAALPPVLPDHTAYILFTSGSTGKPKGVPIRHDALANLLLSMKDRPGISAADAVLGLTTFTFDISTLEFFLPLIAGAQLFLVDYETSLDNEKLAALIERERVSFIQATPSRWTMVLETGWKGRPGMKLLAGGEAVSRSLADALLAISDSVWNMYGPTETTVWSSVDRLARDASDPSIGLPIANTDFYVLDASNRALPAGIPGELAIGGAGLSAGYLHRPDLTQDRFIEIDADGKRRRVYKTGDLAVQKANGTIRCLGRIDFQVKIRGFRIELGEIESLLREFAGIREAVCTVWAHSETDKRIVAYYRADAPVDEALLKAHLRKSLPDYMLPGHFLAVGEFPLTSSGKTNRKALPLPELSAESAAPAAADSMQEKMIGIWAEILGSPRPGVHDNFFDLGGHSVLAVKLIRMLNARLDGNWKLRDLFEHPTIDALARVHQAGEAARASARLPLLFPVSRRGEGMPFFLVSGADATNTYYEDQDNSAFERNFLRYFANILTYMGGKRPVYGLRPRGIYKGERYHTTVAAMAREYIAEIKAVQPSGPYHLGGECVGGVVAYEMARQLQAQGEEVARLVLLDTYRMTLSREIAMHLNDARSDLRIFLIEVAKSLRDGDGRRLRSLLHDKLVRLFPVTRRWREMRYYKRGSRRLAYTIMSYRPQSYDGKMLVVVSEEMHDRHPALFWDNALCPNFALRIVPGDHSTRLNLGSDVLRQCMLECFE